MVARIIDGDHDVVSIDDSTMWSPSKKNHDVPNNSRYLFEAINKHYEECLYRSREGLEITWG